MGKIINYKDIEEYEEEETGVIRYIDTKTEEEVSKEDYEKAKQYYFSSFNNENYGLKITDREAEMFLSILANPKIASEFSNEEIAFMEKASVNYVKNAVLPSLMRSTPNEDNTFTDEPKRL